MLIKTGDEYIFSFNTAEVGGLPGDDAPHLYVIDKDTGEYFNGIVFQNNPYFFVMRHVSNYSYVWRGTFSQAGSFKVSAKSKIDPELTKEEEIDVYNIAAQSIPWVKCTEYNVFYGNGGEQSKIAISRESDSYYFTGEDWVEEETFNNMTQFDDNLWEYRFTPDTSDRYTIQCVTPNTDDEKMVFVLHVYEDREDVAMTHVSAYSLMSPNGDNCLVIEDNEMGPIGGATVSLYSTVNKELMASAVTNSDGSWELDVVPGSYIFSITKDGFENVMFERTI